MKFVYLATINEFDNTGNNWGYERHLFRLSLFAEHFGRQTNWCRT